MELTPLRYFLLAAETENFTRAAEQLLVSQPTLSRAILGLEEELGQPLFEREGRKVTLTDAGRVLEARTRQILSLVDDTKAEITDDGETGRVRVTAIPTIAPYLLPEVLTQFAKVKPAARVIVSEDVTEEALKRLKRGEVDIAVLALPIDETDIDTERLFDEELLAVLPAKHPLLDKKRLTAGELTAEPFILLGEAHCLSDQIVSFCRQKALTPVAVERTSQLATVQELVALGHGVSLVPSMAARADSGKRRVYRRLAGTRPTRAVAMAWNPYRFESRLTVAFKRILLDVAEAVLAQPEIG